MDRACPKCKKDFEWTLDVSSLTSQAKRSSLLPAASSKCDHLVCCTCLFDHRFIGGKTFLRCPVCNVARAFDARSVRVSTIACELLMRTNPRMTVVATPPPLLTNDRRVASLARYSRRRAAVLARQAAQANTPRLTEVEDQDIAAPAGDDEANAKITVRSASQYLTNGASGSATGAGVAVGAHAAVSSLDVSRKTDGRAGRDPSSSSPASDGRRLSSSSSEETVPDVGGLLAKREDGVLIPTTTTTIGSAYSSPSSFGVRNGVDLTPGDGNIGIAPGVHGDVGALSVPLRSSFGFASQGPVDSAAQTSAPALLRPSSRNEPPAGFGLSATTLQPDPGESFGVQFSSVFGNHGQPQPVANAPGPAQNESPSTAPSAAFAASASPFAPSPTCRPVAFGKGLGVSSATGFGAFGSARAPTSVSCDTVPFARGRDSADRGATSAQSSDSKGIFGSFSSTPTTTNGNLGADKLFDLSKFSSLGLRRMNGASKPHYLPAPHTVTEGHRMLNYQSISSAFDKDEISFEEARWNDYGDGNFGTAQPVAVPVPPPVTASIGQGGERGGQVGDTQSRPEQPDRQFFLAITRNLETSNRVAVDALARSDRALGDMNNLMERVNGLQVGYTDLNDNVNFLREQVETLEEEDEDIREDIAVLSDNMDNLAMDTNEVSGNVATITDDVVGLESDIEGVRSDLNVLGEDVEGIGGDVNGIRGDVNGLRGDITELRQRLLVLERALEMHDSEASGDNES